MAKKRKLKLPDVTPESLKKVIAEFKDADGWVSMGAEKKLLPYAVAVMVKVFERDEDARALRDVLSGLGLSLSHALQLQGLMFHTLANARIEKDFVFDNLIDATVDELRARRKK